MSVTFPVLSPNSDKQQQYPGVQTWPVYEVPRYTNLTFLPQEYRALHDRVRRQPKGALILTSGQYAVRGYMWPEIVKTLLHGPNKMDDARWHSTLDALKQHDSSCVAPGADPAKPYTQLPLNILLQLMDDPATHVEQLMHYPATVWERILPHPWFAAIRSSEIFAWDNASSTYVHLQGSHALSLASQSCAPPQEFATGALLLDRLWVRLKVLAPDQDVLVITDDAYEKLQDVPVRTLRFHSTA